MVFIWANFFKKLEAGENSSYESANKAELYSFELNDAKTHPLLKQDYWLEQFKIVHVHFLVFNLYVWWNKPLLIFPNMKWSHAAIYNAESLREGKQKGLFFSLGSRLEWRYQPSYHCLLVAS